MKALRFNVNIPLYIALKTLGAANRVKLKGMMTHKFTIDQYAELIETNMAKQKHNVIKSAVSFL